MLNELKDWALSRLSLKANKVIALYLLKLVQGEKKREEREAHPTPHDCCSNHVQAMETLPVLPWRGFTEAQHGNTQNFLDVPPDVEIIYEHNLHFYD